MKTTIDLPDLLLIAAKKRAAETRSTLRELVTRGLRRELHEPRRPKRRVDIRSLMRRVTAPGGLPPGVDLSNRAKMWDWIQNERDRLRH